jgi:adenine nucleotide transporter 17
MATSLFASSVSGIINVLMTNPLWVASLRMMEGKVSSSKDAANGRRIHQASLFAIMSGIAKSEGLQQLWSGTWTSLLLVSNPIIQHFVYEQMRSWSLQKQQRQLKHQGRGMQSASLSPAQAFVFGAVAKAVATVMTYPLQLAQVLLRLQTRRIKSSITEESNRAIEQRDAVEKSYNGTMDCLRRQFSNGGISALFMGMNAKLLQTVLTSAFTFVTYEQILAVVAGIYDTVK